MARKVDWRPVETAGPGTSAMLSVGVVRDRALVLGVMGRTSIEGDCVTRGTALERMHRIFDGADPSDPVLLMDSVELFADLRVGGRLAIPDLNQFRQSSNPWIRMWATEALRRIAPNDN